MNKILGLIFNQWQEDRPDGKAEVLAYNFFSEDNNHTVDEAIENHNYLSNAMNEIAERAFLAGFNTAVGLKDLVDGKAAD